MATIERIPTQEQLSDATWWSKTADQVTQELKTDPVNGLSVTEIATRQIEFGKNSLPEEERETVWQSLINAFKDPLALILTAAAIISAVVHISKGETSELQQSVWIMAIVVFMVLVGYFTDRSAGNELEKLKALQKTVARAVRGGKLVDLEASELVPGDAIVLKQGDRVPADARVIRSTNGSVSEALLTGEPEAKEKSPAPIPSTSELAQRDNMVFAGTYVESGNLDALVTSTGVNTELGKIWNELSAVEETETPLQKQLEQLGRMLMIGTLIVCVAVILIYVIFQSYNIIDALLVAVALAIAFIPEALGAIITIALALGVREMVTKRAIIRKLRAAEGLGSVSVVCTDKTGTITFGKMTVTHIWTLDTDEVNVEHQTLKRYSVELLRLMDVARLANNLSDPSELALGQLAEMAGFTITPEDRAARVKEFPFNSASKRMGVIHPEKLGATFRSKGAPEILLERCTHILYQGKPREITSVDVERVRGQLSKFESQGYRVLAFAERELGAEHLNGHSPEFREDELTFVGLVALSDPARPEVAETVAKLREAGITAKMITGDSPITALSIAKSVGIVPQSASPSAVIEGRELAAWEKEAGECADSQGTSPRGRKKRSSGLPTRTSTPASPRAIKC
ncbi:MAG: HAD-IC family P-type ATPase [Chloroflexi bacterium]|nr:HAD-IC family P-type ATPase [Chloroflexota bacterium]